MEIRASFQPGISREKELRLIIATMLACFTSTAGATCYQKAYSADGEELVDQVAYLACVVDEQNKAIADLTKQIERMSLSMDALSSTISSR